MWVTPCRRVCVCVRARVRVRVYVCRYLVQRMPRMNSEILALILRQLACFRNLRL